LHLLTLPLLLARYMVGVALCISVQRLKPLHSLNPEELKKRLLNFFWARWGVEEGGTEPTKLISCVHVLLQVCILSYLLVGTHLLPEAVDSTDTVARYRL
jgi:hypothetical protein